MSEEQLVQIVLDTETTGLTPIDTDGTAHRIIDIGCVRLAGRNLSFDPKDQYQTYLNPERPIPEETVRVHHITDEMVADKPKFADIVDDFLAFVTGAELLIHNAEFDVGFINAELARVGRGKLEDYCPKITDTIPIAKTKFPFAGLDYLCEKYEIDLNERKVKGHGALLDSYLLAEVYLKLTQEQGTMELSNMTDISEDYTKMPSPSAFIVLKATDDELAEHERMLDLVEKKSKAVSAWRKAFAPESVEAEPKP